MSSRAESLNESELLDYLNANQPPFSRKIGLRYVSAQADRVVSEMNVMPDMTTGPDFLHGGAIMSMADTTGAMSTMINVSEDKFTTTIESKTNFFTSIAVGDVAVAEAVPLHRGRRTHVWQTRITRKSDGRLVAQVMQTQMVLAK